MDMYVTQSMNICLCDLVIHKLFLNNYEGHNCSEMF